MYEFKIWATRITTSHTQTHTEGNDEHLKPNTILFPNGLNEA